MLQQARMPVSESAHQAAQHADCCRKRQQRPGARSTWPSCAVRSPSMRLTASAQRPPRSQRAGSCSAGRRRTRPLLRRAPGFFDRRLGAYRAVQLFQCASSAVEMPATRARTCCSQMAYWPDAAACGPRPPIKPGMNMELCGAGRQAAQAGRDGSHWSPRKVSCRAGTLQANVLML